MELKSNAALNRMVPARDGTLRRQKRDSELLIWAENEVTPHGLSIRGYSSIRVAPPPDPLPQKVRGKGIS